MVRKDMKWAEYCPPQSKVQLVQKPSLTSDEPKMKSHGGGQAIVRPGLPEIEGFPRLWNLKAKIRNVLKTSPCHWPAQWLDMQEEQARSVVQGKCSPRRFSETRAAGSNASFASIPLQFSRLSEAWASSTVSGSLAIWAVIGSLMAQGQAWGCCPHTPLMCLPATRSPDDTPTRLPLVLPSTYAVRVHTHTHTQ